MKIYHDVPNIQKLEEYSSNNVLKHKPELENNVFIKNYIEVLTNEDNEDSKVALMKKDSAIFNIVLDVELSELNQTERIRLVKETIKQLT